MRERTNEEELDLFADLIEPFAEILQDGQVMGVLQNGGKPITAVKWAIKNHKQTVVEILARIDDVPVEGYKVSAITLPIKLLNLFNRPEFKELFTGQGQQITAGSSGSATGNTEDGVQ